MKCKNCNENEAIKYSKYTNGEFCSKKCARLFSPKQKRNETNKKVSEKLTGRKLSNEHRKNISKSRKGRKNVISEETKNKISIALKKRSEKISDIEVLYKTCESCKNKFLAGNKNTKRANSKKYCSRECFLVANSSSASKAHMSTIMCEKAMRGLIKNKGVKCKYVFNGKIIKCDSKVEYACLDFFEKKYNVIDIERCQIIIKYEYENKEKGYNPDFLIATKEGKFMVECKTIIKNKFLNDKWRKYNEISEIKKIKLEEYAEKNKINSFWFTKDLHRKFYDSLKNKKDIFL